ncbi:MAG: DUF2905 domain-containing protein [Candidatus Acidiferrales bacterium]|jgi:hypothetical protein
MEPAREFGKLLVIAGAVIAVTGAFLLLGGRLPFPLGRLPGDIVYRGKNGAFYFPIVTCLIVSVVLTFLFWVVNHFRR